jgi:chromosome segregation ATPase
LELQLEEGRENVTNYSKDKRALDKDLKSAVRELEDEQSIATGLSLRIETLERNVKKIEEETERDLIRKDLLDEQNYSLKREKDTLRAQLDAALFVNEKLNAELPKSTQFSDEQDASGHDSKVHQQETTSD